jgi:hypothetical protein
LTLVLKINLSENIVKYFEINFGHLKCPDDADVVWSRRQRKSPANQRFAGLGLAGQNTLNHKPPKFLMGKQIKHLGYGSSF